MGSEGPFISRVKLRPLRQRRLERGWRLTVAAALAQALQIAIAGVLVRTKQTRQRLEVLGYLAGLLHHGADRGADWCFELQGHLGTTRLEERLATDGILLRLPVTLERRVF